MDKFTIFTVILAISAVTVTADLGVRQYYATGAAQEASVLTSEADVAPVPQAAVAPPASVLAVPPAAPPAALPPRESSDLPQSIFITPPQAPVSSLITEERIRSAGFSGKFEEKQFSGKVFQLLDIMNIAVEGVSFYQVSQEEVPVVSITEIALRDEIRALELYSLLQNKTKPYIDLALNETNAYGDRSFYINHAKKPEEAFLTVKIGKLIYAFAYVKGYHPLVKKFVQSLLP